MTSLTYGHPVRGRSFYANGHRSTSLLSHQPPGHIPLLRNSVLVWRRATPVLSRRSPAHILSVPTATVPPDGHRATRRPPGHIPSVLTAARPHPFVSVEGAAVTRVAHGPYEGLSLSQNVSLRSTSRGLLGGCPGVRGPQGGFTMLVGGETANGQVEDRSVQGSPSRRGGSPCYPF